MDERELKRISLMIGEDQYEQLTDRGLTVSWLIRDLLDDYLSANKISIRVSPETRKLYEKIVSSSGEEGLDFEPYLKTALNEFLRVKIVEMQKLQKSIEK